MTDKDQSYNYQIVEFVRRGPKTNTKSIDCVPSHWLSFNKKKGKLECRYMELPYEEADYVLINNLIQMNAPVPEEWPLHTVNIKGGASRYMYIFFKKSWYSANDI